MEPKCGICTGNITELMDQPLNIATVFAIKELKLCGPDFDIDWITKFCPIDRQTTINKLQAFWREHAIT